MTELTEAERRALHDGVCPNHRDTVNGVFVCRPCEVAGDRAVEIILDERLQSAAADERARIVWWLRAAADGPGRMNHSSDFIQAIVDMADAIEQHPERFAEAPTGRGART